MASKPRKRRKPSRTVKVGSVVRHRSPSRSRILGRVLEPDIYEHVGKAFVVRWGRAGFRAPPGGPTPYIERSEKRQNLKVARDVAGRKRDGRGRFKK